jgi:carbamoyl-phosphate synthase small subunit
VIRDLPILSSSWRQQMTLAQYLVSERVVAIAEIDTRRLTRLIRTKGALSGCIVGGHEGASDEGAAIEAARNKIREAL